MQRRGHPPGRGSVDAGSAPAVAGTVGRPSGQERGIRTRELRRLTVLVTDLFEHLFTVNGHVLRRRDAETNLFTADLDNRDRHVRTYDYGLVRTSCEHQHHQRGYSESQRDYSPRGKFGYPSWGYPFRTIVLPPIPRP